MAEFVIDHFGQETLDYLAEPLLSGVYGGDPAQMSVASVLPRFAEMEAKYGSLGRAVLKAPAARSVRRYAIPDAEGRSGRAHGEARREGHAPAWNRREHRARGRIPVRADGEWMEAQQVILACPAWAAAELRRLRSIQNSAPCWPRFPIRPR